MYKRQAEVSRYRQCQRRRQRRRRRHASWWLGVVVGVYGLTARAATLHRHLRRCVVSLRALGRCETARVLLDRMRDARGELTPGVRHYVIASCAAAVAHDRAFDERTVLDGRGWEDGSSSSSSASGSCLSSSGSSLRSYISAAVVSTAAVSRPRDGQQKYQRQRWRRRWQHQRPCQHQGPCQWRCQWRRQYTSWCCGLSS